MNRSLRVACVLLVAAAAGSCQSTAKPAASARPHAAVTHVVLCWLKTAGDQEGRARIVEASRTFASIPGVVTVTTGRPLASTRPVDDSSFDVAVVIAFEHEAALRAYDAHPTHKQAVDEVLRPLVGKFVIYDVKHD